MLNAQILLSHFGNWNINVMLCGSQLQQCTWAAEPVPHLGEVGAQHCICGDRAQTHVVKVRPSYHAQAEDVRCSEARVARMSADPIFATLEATQICACKRIAQSVAGGYHEPNSTRKGDHLPNEASVGNVPARPGATSAVQIRSGAER